MLDPIILEHNPQITNSCYAGFEGSKEFYHGPHGKYGLLVQNSGLLPMIVRSVRGKNIPLRNMSYQVVRGIYARALLAAITDGDAFTNNMLESIARAVKRCMIKISRDLDTIGDMIAASNVPAGPEYDIFTLTQAAGDEIFASKKVRATGLLVSH